LEKKYSFGERKRNLGKRGENTGVKRHMQEGGVIGVHNKVWSKKSQKSRRRD